MAVSPTSFEVKVELFARITIGGVTREQPIGSLGSLQLPVEYVDPSEPPATANGHRWPCPLFYTGNWRDVRDLGDPSGAVRREPGAECTCGASLRGVL